MVDQNDSIMRLSTLEATRPIEPRSPAARRRWPKTQRCTDFRDRSARIVPGCGRRRQVAICRASTTSSVRMWSAIDQPTTTRENTSRTAQQYTFPVAVGCSVMSVHHSRFGASATNRRPTRSSCAAGAGWPRRFLRWPDADQADAAAAAAQRFCGVCGRRLRPIVQSVARRARRRVARWSRAEATATSIRRRRVDHFGSTFSRAK